MSLPIIRRRNNMPNLKISYTWSRESYTRKHRISQGKSPVSLLLFYVVALKSVLFSHFVLAFIPQQSLRSGEEINSPHCGDPVVRLSSFSDDSYCHDNMADNDFSTGNSATLAKRKNKHQKRKSHAQKRSKTGSTGKLLLSGDELATYVTSQYSSESGSGDILLDAGMRKKRQEASSTYYQADSRHQDHIAYLKMLDRHPTLVLNADYQPLSALPLSLWSWRDTVKSVFAGKVVVVDVYPNATIRAVNIDMALPSVIALTEYVSQPSHMPTFTRKNVFLRDGYRCQYCASQYRFQELSLDHVIPRCMGGKLEWENAVTCCKKCNGQKGSRLPSDLRSVGMKLLRTPRVPTKYELAAISGAMIPRRVHPTWTPFLGMIVKPSDKGTGEEVKFCR